MLYFFDSLAQSQRFQLLKNEDKILEEDGNYVGKCWGAQERELGMDVMMVHFLMHKI